MELNLLDKRDVTDNVGMFEACRDHIGMAVKSGVTSMYVTCFAPAAPGSRQGPRIWNDQILRYAAYHDGESATEGVSKKTSALTGAAVLGDPANLAFTDMLTARFGWKGPSGTQERSAWDYLPLVCQADPNAAPELFELQNSLAPPVMIWHPDYPFLAQLKLRWYPVPAVCALEATIGGLLYTGMPFNGWYALTEVVRDFCDESRYNVLPAVASLMGVDITSNATLWKDRAQLVISRAVLFSYAHSQISMVDHHTLMDGFWKWYHDELRNRGYCPGNWKWIIPPQASSTSRCYLGLNKMTEYTLRPAYVVAPCWKAYAEAWFGGGTETEARTDPAGCHIQLEIEEAQTTSVVLVYASVSGTCRLYASKLHGLLSGPGVKCTLLDVETFDANATDGFETTLRRACLLIILSSTYGSGEVPVCAKPFLKYLSSEKCTLSKDTFPPCAVLGFGSSNYPFFCGSVDKIEKLLTKREARLLCPSGRCDDQSSPSRTFDQWAHTLVTSLATEMDIHVLAETIVAQQCTRANVNIEYVSHNETVTHALEMLLGPGAVDGSANVRKMPWPMRLFMPSTTKKRAAVRTNEQRLDRRSPLRRKTDVKSTTQLTGRSAPNAWLVGTLLSVSPLQGAASPDNFERQTSLVRISLQSCGDPPYNPGDHALVLPHNTVSECELVQFAKHLGERNLNQVFVASISGKFVQSEVHASMPLLAAVLGKPTSIRQLLSLIGALDAMVSMHACEALSHHAKSNFEAARLHQLGEDQREHDAAFKTNAFMWRGLFTAFPSLSGRVKLKDFLLLAQLNHERPYSIASCKDAVGPELHLCVGRYVYKRKDNVNRTGVASEFLTFASPGTEVYFRLQSFPSFYLPSDGLAPVVLVAAGTGLAPIRGLIQQRVVAAERNEPLGPAYFIFGCRTPDDLMCRNELDAAVQRGGLTQYFVAFSRYDLAPKHHVDTFIVKEKELFRPVLSHPNAHVYICGSSAMAATVQDAIAKVTGSELIASMITANRIHQDIFGNLGNAQEAGHVIFRSDADEEEIVAHYQRRRGLSTVVQSAKALYAKAQSFRVSTGTWF